MSIQDVTINDMHDRISRILKNDQKYSYTVMGEAVVKHIQTLQSAESYFAKYPPLLDIAELGAALGYEGSAYQDEILRQLRYKLLELRQLLPDIK